MPAECGYSNNGACLNACGLHFLLMNKSTHDNAYVSNLLKLSILVIILFVYPDFLFANNYQYNFNRFEIGDGLSDNHVTGLAQDQNDYLWIGTRNGLNRFDGQNFQLFSVHSSENAISNNDILLLHFDDNTNRLWIATKTGIDFIDTVSLSARQVLKYQTHKLDLIEQVISIDQQNILLVNGQGAYIYSLPDGIMENIPQFRIGKYSILDVIKGTDKKIYCLTKDKILSLHLGSAGWELITTYGLDERFGFRRFVRVNDDFWLLGSSQLRRIALADKSDIDVIPLNVDNLAGNEVVDMLNVSDQHLSVLTRNDYFEFDLLVKKLTKFPQLETNIRPTVMLNGPKGLTWYGSENNGLTQLTKVNRKIATQSFDTMFSETDERTEELFIFRSFQDNKKRLWFANSQTLFLINQQGLPLRLSQLKPNFPDIVGAKYLFQDKNQTIWVFTEKNIFLLNENQATFKQLDIAINNVEFVRERTDELDIWTEDASLYQVALEQPTRITERLSYLAEELNRFGQDFVVFGGLYREQDKRTFISTDHGLLVLSNTNKVVIRLHKLHEKEQRRLANDWVTALLNHEQELWVGTFDGLYLIDLDSMLIKKEFLGGRELPSGLIFGIYLDQANNVWVTTDKGLSVYWRNNERWQAINHLHGLKPVRFFRSSHRNMLNGTLYIPTEAGIMRLESIVASDFDGAMKMTINGLAKSSNLLKQHTASDDAFQVTHNDQVFLVDFKMVDFIEPNRLRYQYRLDGYDNGWFEVANNIDRVQYSGVAPGNYSFRVRALKSDQVLPNSEAKQKIQVLTAPWATKWAYASYIVTLSFILWLISIPIRGQRRMKHIAAKKVAESESRMRLALNASDQLLWDWFIDENKVDHFGEHQAISFVEFFANKSLQVDNYTIEQSQFDELSASLTEHLQLKNDYFQASYSLHRNGEQCMLVEKGQITEVDHHGAPTRMSGVVKDITQKRQDEARFNLMASAFDNASDGVCMVTVGDHTIEAVNHSFSRITGWAAIDIVGQNLDTILSIDDHSVSLEIFLNEALRNNNSELEVKGFHRSGNQLNIELTIEFITDDLNQMSHFLIFMKDITERIKSKERLEQLANYDQLTGLPNRIMFIESLSTRCKLARKNNRRHALLFCQVTNFSSISNLFSHSATDALLKKVAEKLKQELHSDDLMAKLDGPEYAIFLHNAESNHSLSKLIEHIQNVAEEPFYIIGQEIKVELLVGVARFPEDAKNHFKLLVNAKMALENAHKNKQKYEFFQERMTRDLQNRFFIEKKLLYAIDSNEFQLYFQPKVSVKDGKVIGAETLIRWIDSQGHMIMPDQFIPIAEENGMIKKIDEFVLTESCRCIQKWHEAGVNCGTIAVNLSAQQFADGQRLITLVEQLLSEFNIPPFSLEIEITEGMLVNDTHYAMKIIDFLRSMNITVAIDDFGTGYSSLNYLKNFSTNTLKIDRSFIRDMEHSEKDQSIVKSIIGLAHSLGMHVVAEGVEIGLHLEILKEFDCESYQGFFFSKPLPLAEFEQIIDRQEA